MAVTETSPAWWPDCENCGNKAQNGEICDNCGHRNGRDGHTHMAYGNTDRAGYYAVIADNVQWADDRRSSDVTIHAHRERVAATLRACGRPSKW